MNLAIPAAALALDLLLGEPPNALHPTAWMGRIILRLWGGSAPKGKVPAFLKGAGICLFTILVFALPLVLLTQLTFPGKFVLEILFLKMTFSFRGLFKAGNQIKSALLGGDEKEARRLLSWHLVSRNTENLDSRGITAAVLESVSENLTDSLTAPLFFFLLFGLPGAFAYRVVNTCDAMLGYRDEKREWLGKFSARLDDVLNFIPARFTALMILAAGLFFSGSRGAAGVLIRNHQKTASPNSGWTMAALAGVMGVCLSKEGVYRLNPRAPEPEPKDLARGLVICFVSGLTAVTVLLAAAGVVVYGL